PRRPDAFSSWARSFIAPRSSAVNPSYDFPVAALLRAGFCLSFMTLMLGNRPHRLPGGRVAQRVLGGGGDAYHRVGGVRDRGERVDRVGQLVGHRLVQAA